jgi:hypothetical protein
MRRAISRLQFNDKKPAQQFAGRQADHKSCFMQDIPNCSI